VPTTEPGDQDIFSSSTISFDVFYTEQQTSSNRNTTQIASTQGGNKQFKHVNAARPTAKQIFNLCCSTQPCARQSARNLI